MKYSILIILLSAVLMGCNHNPTATDVIVKPQTCYVVPQKPQLVEINISVEQLMNGEWAITIDDVNFNALLSNNVVVDTYIENSYNTLMRYNSDCNDLMDRPEISN